MTHFLHIHILAGVTASPSSLLWRPSPPLLHLFLGEREETGERKQMEGRSGQKTRAVSGGDSQRHSQALDGLLQPTPPPSAWLPPTPAEVPDAAPPGTPSWSISLWSWRRTGLRNPMSSCRQDWVRREKLPEEGGGGGAEGWVG